LYTSVNAITGDPYVFKTPHDNILIRDLEYFLWEIALATSAAPTYFPLAKLNIPNSSASNLFVDGGLWANNPSIVALVEALSYGKSKIEDIYLLSVGNIKSKTTFKSDTLAQKGILFWRQKVINMTLETQSLAIHNQLRLLFQNLNLTSRYIRVEHDQISRSHNCLKTLDCATKANLNDLEVYGRERANIEGVKKQIIAFFKEI
jgi:patatin-like phospholipase/acyl hydrolase